MATREQSRAVSDETRDCTYYKRQYGDAYTRGGCSDSAQHHAKYTVQVAMPADQSHQIMRGWYHANGVSKCFYTTQGHQRSVLATWTSAGLPQRTCRWFNSPHAQALNARWCQPSRTRRSDAPLPSLRQDAACPSFGAAAHWYREGACSERLATCNGALTWHA